MKTLNTLVLLAALFTVTGLNAQTTYNVTRNSNYSATGIPTSCVNCVIRIADGVTLTVDRTLYLQNVSFIGGTPNKSTIVATEQGIVFYSTGSFTNIIGNLKGSLLWNSQLVTFTNSAFTFSNGSVATVYNSVSLVSSTWKFLDNSVMNATGGTFSIRNGSLTLGDGTPSSTAYAYFSGAQLSLLDATSFVTAGNNRNFYYNYSNYNGNGVSRRSTDNRLNCGGAGQNLCESPFLYGPSSLTAAGVTNNAMLPVKLASFTAKANGNTVVLNWITAQEINSEVFEIERSIDGINWMKVGEVKAKGNSWMPSKYTYSDVVKNGSSFTYRMKMVDIDKQYEYSSIVKISLNGVEGGSIKSYPNPATNFFAVDGVSAGSQLVMVNMNGAVVKVINGYVSNSKVSLDGILAGNYVVKVVDAHGSSQAFKMIVAR